jgi:hypothetical protein
VQLLTQARHFRVSFVVFPSHITRCRCSSCWTGR